MNSIIYEQDNHIVTITLNRPDSLNSFNCEMYKEFNQALSRFRDDDDAWVCVINSAGERAFCAGAEVEELDDAIEEAGHYDEETSNLVLAEECFTSKPVIAAIHGYCIGEGVTLALYCDLRICSNRAVFFVPEASVGFPAVRIPARAAQVLGLGHAMDLVLLGERRDADWALRSGLVSQVVEPGEMMETALEWARKLCKMSQPSIRAMKEVMLMSLDHTYQDTVATGSKLRTEITQSNESADIRRRFLDKTK